MTKLVNISRRGFLKNTAAGTLATGIGGALILPEPARAEPQKGGHLRLGMAHGATSDTLDPGNTGPVTRAVTFAAFNNLTEIDANGELIGELAETWDVSDDATVWTFNLRRGVQFQDGQDLKAEDVIATLHYHIREDSTSGQKKLISDIAEMTAPDDHTVQITLSSGNVDFAAILAGPGYIIKKKKGDIIDPDDTNGTGAYVIEKFDPGVVTELVRNENYWKAGRGHFDRVSILSILDPSARTTALQTGAVDVIDGVDLKTVNLLKRVDGITVHSVTSNLHYTFSMHTDTAPYDDVNVRLALKYGINREELVQKILNGYGSPGNDHPIGPGYSLHAADIEQRSYDPDKAKFHLKEAGLDSLDVSLSAADAAFSGSIDAASLYAESIAGSGVNINVVREPSDGYWKNVYLVKPFVSVFWGGQATAGSMLELAYAAGSKWNETKWQNARFNELLSTSKAELDFDKRKEQYREMQMLIRDDGGAVVPMFSDFVLAANEKVKFEKLGSRLVLDDFRFAERWWFA